MGKPAILLSNASLKGLRRRLDEEFETVALWDYPDAEALVRERGSPRAMLASGGVRRRLIDALPGLELIVSYGSGYDGIDVALDEVSAQPLAKGKRAFEVHPSSLLVLTKRRPRQCRRDASNLEIFWTDRRNRMTRTIN